MIHTLHDDHTYIHTDEGSKSSDDLENVYYVGIQNLESAVLNNVKGTVTIVQCISILRYLRDLPDLKITYRRSGNKELLGYSGSCYATGDNPERSRSTIGTIDSTMFFLLGGLVHFSSQLQKTVAQSIIEAELIALNSCAKSGIYLLGARIRVEKFQRFQNLLSVVIAREHLYWQETRSTQVDPSM